MRGRLLQTEVEDEVELEALLTHAVHASPFLRALSVDDIACMASHLAVLSFEAEEVIMEKGETASWIGIVLSGSLGEFIDDQQVGQPILPGTMVGEMAFFAGGIRTANIRAVSKGFLATMMINELTPLFEAMPRTTFKLISALATASISKLTTNSPGHQPLRCDLAAADAAEEITTWLQHFSAKLAEFEINEEEARYLASLMKFHRFDPEEMLLDAHALNECTCFLVAGSVDLVQAFSARKLTISTNQEAVLGGISFFARNAMPMNIIGHEAGLLAMLPKSSIEALGYERPRLALALLRMIGSSAVDTCSELMRPPDRPLQPQDGSSKDIISTQRIPLSWIPASIINDKANEPIPQDDGNAAISSVGGKEADTMTQASASASPDLEVFYRRRLARQKETPVKPSSEAGDSNEVVDDETDATHAMKTALRNAQIANRTIEREKHRVEADLAKANLHISSLRDQVRDLQLDAKDSNQMISMLRRRGGEASFMKGSSSNPLPRRAGSGDSNSSFGGSKRRRASADVFKGKGKGRAGELLGAAFGRTPRNSTDDSYASGEASANDDDAPDEKTAAQKMTLLGLRAELDTAYETLDKQKVVNVKLREQIESLKSDKARLAMSVSEGNKNIEKSGQKAAMLRNLLQAGFEKEKEAHAAALEAAKRDEERLIGEKAGLVQELKRKAVELKITVDILGTELKHAESSMTRQIRLMEHQRVAAKGLGIVYVSQLYPLKKELARLRTKEKLDQEVLLTMPFRLKTLQQQKDRLEQALKIAKDSLTPLERKLEQQTKACQEAETKLSATEAMLSVHMERESALEAQATHLVGEVTRAGVEARRLDRALVAALKREGEAIREIRSQTSRADQTANAAGSMAARVVTLEKSFGPLLLDPQQTAAAATGLLSGQPRPSNYFPPRSLGPPITPLGAAAFGALRSSSSSSSMLADRIQSSRSLSRPQSQGSISLATLSGPDPKRFAPSRNPPSRRGGREQMRPSFQLQHAKGTLSGSGPLLLTSKEFEQIASGSPTDQHTSSKNQYPASINHGRDAVSKFNDPRISSSEASIKVRRVGFDSEDGPWSGTPR